MILTILAAAITYAAAAWLGTLISDWLYSGQTPFPDGPATVTVPAWAFPAAGALLGAAVALHGASMTELAIVGLVTIALVAGTATDLKCGVVPDIFTLLPLAGLVLWFGFHGDYGPLFSALVVGLPFAVVAALTRGHGLGWGDVKLAALGGALLGARGAALAFAIGCVAAFVISRFLTPRGKPVAFAPYLVGGIGAVLMIGSAI